MPSIHLAARFAACRVQYDLAAKRQHAVIWDLSTGIIRDVVWVYRIYRRDCSSHGITQLGGCAGDRALRAGNLDGYGAQNGRLRAGVGDGPAWGLVLVGPAEQPNPEVR
jgi:hypothetical protein